jgi:CBS domain containing-hemolysin-like protein
VVVNQYRETVGVITVEDIIEQLIGRKIIDQFDEYDDLRAVAETNPRKNNLPKRGEDIA